MVPACPTFLLKDNNEAIVALDKSGKLAEVYDKNSYGIIDWLIPGYKCINSDVCDVYYKNEKKSSLSLSAHPYIIDDSRVIAIDSAGVYFYTLPE